MTDSKHTMAGFVAALRAELMAALDRGCPVSLDPAVPGAVELGAMLDEMVERARESRSPGGLPPWVLSAVAEKAPVMVFLKDAEDLRVRFWNEQAEAISGVSRADILDRTGLESFPTEQMHEFLERDRRVVDQREQVDVEEQLTNSRTGQSRWIFTRKIPLVDSEDRVRFLLGISEDITERKRLEDERERLTGLLDSIVDNIPIMLFVKDAQDLRMLLWNKAGEELVGVPRAEMIGKTDLDLFPLEQASAFRAKDREVLAKKTLLEVEEPITSPTRGDRWLHTKKIPLMDQDGSPRYLVGISEDITERRAAEHALRAAKDAAEAADRAKTEFFANVSHELRTPLTLILGPLDALIAGEAGALPQQALDRLARMRRNGGRLASLVNDLLDFAKLEAGKLAVSRSPVAVADALRDLVEDARATATSRGLTLSLEVAADPGVVRLDARMFEKIAMNLVGNALKFTPAGGAVVVGVGGGAGELVIEVRDTGIGIADDRLPLLFQRFQQVDSSATRKYEGTGLGLALVKEFSELMGGTAEVASNQAGPGVTFRVRLPRVADDIDAQTTHATEAEAAVRFHDSFAHLASAERVLDEVASPAMGKPRLLLAEDNPDMRGYVRELLEGDYAITAVENGRAALEAARRSIPDVVVSDVMMPEMDGFELVKMLKADPLLAQVPVILLTARAGNEAVATALDGGADDYLSKPFSPAELRARVASARRLRKALVDLSAQIDELQAVRDLVEELRTNPHPTPSAPS